MYDLKFQAHTSWETELVRHFELEMDEKEIREGRSLAETPTWTVATVITVMVALGFCLNGSLERLGKVWCIGYFGYGCVKTKKVILVKSNYVESAFRKTHFALAGITKFVFWSENVRDILNLYKWF